MKKLWPFFVLAFCAGCWKVEDVPQALDRLSFQHVGGTLFANPEQLTLKEIHLDTGALAGREIIVEGQVADVSAHGTYLVLKDESARLLVVLTDLVDAGGAVKDPKPETLRVLGTVESGKKGLPYLKARAVGNAEKKT